MVAVFWLLFGALMGYLAAQRNGWSQVAGLIGGALLGLLSPLLFLARGVGVGDAPPPPQGPSKPGQFGSAAAPKPQKGFRLWWVLLIGFGAVFLASVCIVASQQ